MSATHDDTEACLPGSHRVFTVDPASPTFNCGVQQHTYSDVKADGGNAERPLSKAASFAGYAQRVLYQPAGTQNSSNNTNSKYNTPGKHGLSAKTLSLGTMVNPTTSPIISAVLNGIMGMAPLSSHHFSYTTMHPHENVDAESVDTEAGDEDGLEAATLAGLPKEEQLKFASVRRKQRFYDRATQLAVDVGKHRIQVAEQDRSKSFTIAQLSSQLEDQVAVTRRLEAALSASQADCSSLTIALTASNNGLNDAKQEIQRLNMRLDDNAKQAALQLQDQRTVNGALAQQLDETRKLLDVSRDEIAKLLREISNSKDENTQSLKRLEDGNAQVRALALQLQQLQTAETFHQKRIAELELSLRNETDTNADLRKSVSDLQLQMSDQAHAAALERQKLEQAVQAASNECQMFQKAHSEASTSAKQLEAKLEKCQSDEREAATKCAQLQSVMKVHDSTLADLRAQLDKCRAELADTRQAMEDEKLRNLDLVRDLERRLHDALSAKDRESNAVETSQKQLEREIIQQAAELASSKQSLSELQSKYDSTASRLLELESSMSHQRQIMNDLTRQLEETKVDKDTTVSRVLERLEMAQQQLAVVSSEREACHHQLRDAEKLQQTLTAKHSSAESRIHELESSAKNLTAVINDLSQKLDRASDSEITKHLTDRLHAAQDDISRLTKMNSDLSAKLEEVGAKTRDVDIQSIAYGNAEKNLSERIRALQEQLALTTERAGAAELESALLRQQLAKERADTDAAKQEWAELRDSQKERISQLEVSAATLASASSAKDRELGELLHTLDRYRAMLEDLRREAEALRSDMVENRQVFQRYKQQVDAAHELFGECIAEHESKVGELQEQFAELDRTRAVLSQELFHSKQHAKQLEDAVFQGVRDRSALELRLETAQGSSMRKLLASRFASFDVAMDNMMGGISAAFGRCNTKLAAAAARTDLLGEVWQATSQEWHRSYHLGLRGYATPPLLRFRSKASGQRLHDIVADGLENLVLHLEPHISPVKKALREVELLRELRNLADGYRAQASRPAGTPPVAGARRLDQSHAVLLDDASPRSQSKSRGTMLPSDWQRSLRKSPSGSTSPRTSPSRYDRRLHGDLVSEPAVHPRRGADVSPQPAIYYEYHSR